MSDSDVMFKIIQARTRKHYRWAHQLFRQYADSLGFDLEFQGFRKELATLPGDYGPPEGCILLAQKAEEIIGCVALRSLEKGICEMKRLYVIPACRGRKIGLALAQAVISEARQRGYARMRLDTIESMKEAQAIYHRLGFRPIKPYRYNPLENAHYFELNLTNDNRSGRCRA